MKFRIQLLLLIILFCFLHIQAKGNEVGIATGINSSFYKAWYESRTAYQKSNMLNPIEFYFRKDLLSFFSLFSSLQYNSKSISEWFDRTDEYGEVSGRMYYEVSMNYMSVQVSPMIFYKVNKFIFDIRAGLSGDIYVNQFDKFGDLTRFYRNAQINPFTLSLVSGIGIRYALKERFSVGLSTRLLRTLSDTYKKQTEKNIRFVNWQNLIYTGLSF